MLVFEERFDVKKPRSSFLAPVKEKNNNAKNQDANPSQCRNSFPVEAHTFKSLLVRKLGSAGTAAPLR